MSSIRKKYDVGLGKIKRLWDLDSRKEARDWISNMENEARNSVIDTVHWDEGGRWTYDNEDVRRATILKVSNEIRGKINEKRNANKLSEKVENTNEFKNKNDEKGGNMAGYIGAIIAAAQNALEGAAGVAGGLIGRRQREREARIAGEDFQAQMTALRTQDVDNPFQNVQNTFEDLTVNQKEAEFLAGQQQLGMATTMSQMRRTVGSSGLASMAQAMANQQSINLQKASASIGQQEAANQAMAAKGRFEQEKMFAMGEKEKRMMEFAKQNQLLAMASDRKIAADEAIAAQQAALIGGVGQLVSGTGAFATAMSLKDK